MPLMTSIYTGVTGLRANQNAMNTTAHNLANVYTEGYVRQQAGMVDGIYSNLGITPVNTMQLGLGVVSAESRHLRELLIDKSYRENAGRQAFYESKATAVEEVDTILGELEGVQFQTALKDLKEAISEMAKTPDSTVCRAELIMNAQAFITRSEAVYKELVSYQNTLDAKVQNTIDRINEIGDKIFALNKNVKGIEAAGIETASDFRDQRDLLLDELGSLAKIEYKEDEFGVVTVRLEGTAFVGKDTVYHMGTAQLHGEYGSTYISPVWPHIDNKQVFNTADPTSTAKNNDIGELKGLLIARGGYAATYENVPREPDYSKLATDAEKAAAFDQYQKDVTEYNNGIGGSVIAKAEALFDQIVNHIISQINDTFSPTIDKTYASNATMVIPQGTNKNVLAEDVRAKVEELISNSQLSVDKYGTILSDATITIDAGTSIKILNIEEDENKCSYGCDENKTPGTELFSRNDVSRYTKVTINGETAYVYNPYNEFGMESKYTLGNVSVNQVVIDDYAYIPFTTINEDIDLKRGQKLLEIWDTPSINVDPNNLTTKDFDDYYSAMVGVLANEGYIYKQIAENQTTVVSDLNDKRVSITGVSSEEELSNLIRFQNAYGASSRYITTVADMLDTLINRVGNV